MGKLSEDTTPVSYTHLDVYKRQEELRFMLIEFREEVKQTKMGMNKRWEETSYPVDQLNETVDSDFKPSN